MKSKAPAPDQGQGLKQYLDCPDCGLLSLDPADKELYPGGDGFWEDKIHCLKCAEQYWPVPYERAMVPILAEYYGITEAEAREMEERRRESWARAVSESS